MEGTVEQEQGGSMRVLHSIQVQCELYELLMEGEPFAVVHDNRIAGCYLPTGAEVRPQAAGLFFNDIGICYPCYSRITEYEFLKIMEQFRYGEL